MQLAHQLRSLHTAEQLLASALRAVGDGHAGEADILQLSGVLAAQCDAHAEGLAPFADRYGDEERSAADEPHRDLFGGPRSGPLGLLRDLNDLYLMACECELSWILVAQAARGARDRELLEVVVCCDAETSMQVKWLRTRMKQAAPQALVVA